MHRLVLAVFVLLFNSAACADYVGFTLRAPNDPCGMTWILPNNTQPDFYYHPPLSSPGYNNVSAGSNCVPGNAFILNEVIFLNSGGLAFNSFGVDLLGPVLYTQTAMGVAFNIGVFGLQVDVDPPGFVRYLIDIHAAPEPGTLALLIAGLAAIHVVRSRREQGIRARVASLS